MLKIEKYTNTHDTIEAREMEQNRQKFQKKNQQIKKEKENSLTGTNINSYPEKCKFIKYKPQNERNKISRILKQIK